MSAARRSSARSTTMPRASRRRWWREPPRSHSFAAPRGGASLLWGGPAGGCMNVAVMGAGAVGCYYGGMLARAGHSVTLIGREQHVEAVRRDGLLLDTPSFQAHVPMEASTDPSAVQGARLVLFCVKSTDTDSAAAAIAPHLEPDAL